MSNRAAPATERLNRLAGDGDKRGGGLPLPLVFGAILEELLDNGPATTGRLVAVTRDRQDFNAAQIMSEWDSWEHFTSEVLAQLESRRYVRRDDNGTWHASFTPGKDLVVIPKRPGKNRNNIGVTVYAREEREKRSGAERHEMTVTAASRELRENGRGLRPVDAEHVARIRELVAEFGRHDDVFPVLEAPDGRIIDGRHRLAAYPDWERRVIRSAADEEKALQAALVANETAPWTEADRCRLAEERGAVGGQQAKRERVKQALREYPEASHREIARTLGLSEGGHVQVGRICAAEVEQCSTSPEGDEPYACCHGQTGQGARTDRKPSVNPEVQAKRAEIVRLRDDEHLDWGEIGSRTGRTSKGAEDAYRIATGARDREPARARAAGLPGSNGRAPESRGSIGPHDPAPGHLSRESGLEQIIKVLLCMSPEDRMWVLGELPAQVASVLPIRDKKGREGACTSRPFTVC